MKMRQQYAQSRNLHPQLVQNVFKHIHDRQLINSPRGRTRSETPQERGKKGTENTRTGAPWITPHLQRQDLDDPPQIRVHRGLQRRGLEERAQQGRGLLLDAGVVAVRQLHDEVLEGVAEAGQGVRRVALRQPAQQRQGAEPDLELDVTQEQEKRLEFDRQARMSPAPPERR